MLGPSDALNEVLLARVKDPRRRLLLQDALEDSDRAIEEMVRTEAEARDKLRAAQAKTRAAPRRSRTQARKKAST